MSEMEFIIAHRANLLAMAQALKTLRDAIISDVRLIEKKYNIQPEKGNNNGRTSSTQHYQIKSGENSSEGN